MVHLALVNHDAAGELVVVASAALMQSAQEAALVNEVRVGLEREVILGLASR